MDGSDIEVGTADSKIERIKLFPAFTKASERFRKLNKITIRGYVQCFKEHKEKNPNKLASRRASKNK